jgi:hypothetical protein
VLISRRVSWFLIAFGVWSWIIWPTFLKNIWKDSRSWHDGMTTFFGVHLVLVVVSLVLGTAIGVLGIRALRLGRSAPDGGDVVPAQDRQVRDVPPDCSGG